jgi:hypothetical protein
MVYSNGWQLTIIMVLLGSDIFAKMVILDNSGNVYVTGSSGQYIP